MKTSLLVVAAVVACWLGRKVGPSARKERELREVIIWLFRVLMIAGVAFQLRMKLIG